MKVFLVDSKNVKQHNTTNKELYVTISKNSREQNGSA